MAKFGRLKQLDIKGKTTPFALPEAHVPEFCKEVPVLHLAHMGRSNEDYYNARMAIAANNMARATKTRSADEVDKESMKEALSLNTDRELIPAYVIVGWDHLYDDEGNPVTHSPKEASDLVAQLPDDIVDRMRTVAMNVANYRSTPVVSPAGEAALEGNSQTG
jgi:hypothetical protein